jgi:hypothetical protein
VVHAVKTLWIGGDLPKAQAACLRSFVLCGHRTELFTYSDVGNVPPGVILRDASQILPRSSVFSYGPAAGVNAGSKAGFSNIFRYEMLVREGGCWIDTDVFCLGDLPEGDVYLSSERTKDGAVHATNCLMKCPPRHPLAERCLIQTRRTDPRTMQFGDTGPLLVERLTHEMGLRSVLLDPVTVCPINWHEYKWLDAAGGLAAWRGKGAGLPARARCVHLWNEMFRIEGRPIPWPGLTGSVIANLASRLQEMERRAGSQQFDLGAGPQEHADERRRRLISGRAGPAPA